MFYGILADVSCTQIHNDMYNLQVYIYKNTVILGSKIVYNDATCIIHITCI